MREFERVYTMTDYYDGPRRGIADFCGGPHLYESMFLDIEGGDTDIFRLSPVAGNLLAFALEDWQIWRRWETAFHRGETPHDTHPALPADRARHDELAPILEERLVIADTDFAQAAAQFRVCEDNDWSGFGSRPLEVKWTLVRAGDLPS